MEDLAVAEVEAFRVMEDLQQEVLVDCLLVACQNYVQQVHQETLKEVWFLQQFYFVPQFSLFSYKLLIKGINCCSAKSNFE